MNIYGIDHIVQNRRCQLLQIQVFLRFLTSLCAQCSAERFLIIGNTLDYQPHVLERTFFKYHGTDEVSVADLLALSTGSEAYEVVLSGFKTVAGTVVQFLTAIGTDGRFLGIFSEETVNVLEVNLILDGILDE